MHSETGNTVSLWHATAERKTRAPLAESAEADVVVVGAGIAGLSAAYWLARGGRRVVVLDDGEIGDGATGRTTAHLSTALDDRYYELERLHGEEGARLAAESHAAAIDHIETVVEREGIECAFERVPGYLIAAEGRPIDELARERGAAARAGLEVELVDDVRIGDRAVGPALRFANQAQFHPLRYLAGLARASEALGVRIHAHTHATDVRGGKDACVATRDGFEVRGEAVVVATNTPFNDRFAIHTKQAAYRTFAIAMPVDARIAPGLVWDTGDPYHYVRAHREDGAAWLIVGGEDHKTGQPGDDAECFARLREWTRVRLGLAGEVRYAWSGQIMEPNDGLAFIGRNPHDKDNVYVVTGDSGNGMTHGTLASLLIADLIEGRPNAWERVYSPSRVSLRAGGEFVRENANVARQYAELVTPGEIKDVRGIAPGRAAIVRSGLTKLAAFRDGAGVLHVRSAICTHLGCVVSWNQVEETWDCPCHGSRFDPRDGHVLNGPAAAPLAERDIEV